MDKRERRFRRQASQQDQAIAQAAPQTATRPSGADAVQLGRSSPSRFSSSELEQHLGLPPGAWKSRQLYTVRVLSAAGNVSTPASGDHLVVEPCETAQPGDLVVVRSADKLGLARMRLDGQRKAVLSGLDTSTLPFPSPDRHATVVGVVVARLPAGRTPRSSPNPTTGVKREPVSAEITPSKRARDQGDLQDWQQWAEGCRDRLGGPRSVQLDALASQLATLRACMEVAHDDILYAALSREAGRVVAALKRQSLAGRGLPPTPGCGSATTQRVGDQGVTPE
jgi:hypothetical protein